ncbi:MAG: DUF58 domain-containing protein [Ruminococcus sp.]|uniref:DUF58 domain-containing protein n=1 Tax=Ruminococcus sp. TaxID=41978 RepID=UPI0025FB3810|nr:DUF58 domain-containing protein [Ruminococcus sp.]MBR5683713.1 DUF58 domain-containing protein [Ruminococcus sp.]
MLLTKLLFIILIIICIFFYILYLWDFALVLLVVVAVLPIIMFIITYITKKRISIEFAVKDKSVAKNVDFPVQLVVTNKSFFPIGKADAKIEYYNIFNDEVSAFDLYLPIQARNSQRVTFRLSSKFCGIIKIKSSCLHIYDPLKIFRFKAADCISTEVNVLPEGHDISGIVQYTDRVNEESDIFSEHRAGDDPSEVFDLREYNPGDKLNRIHWKLSSKKDDFIVKEYSMPIDVPCVLFLDLKSYSDNSRNLPVLDTVIETFLSLSQFLLDNERGHSVVFFDASQNCFAEEHIYNPSDLNKFIKKLFLSFTDYMECPLPEKYFIDNSGLSFASFTYISSAADQKVLGEIDENVDADIKNAFIVVSSDKKISECDAAFSSLNITPVLIGRISASIKDIEI